MSVVRQKSKGGKTWQELESNVVAPSHKKHMACNGMRYHAGTPCRIYFEIKLTQDCTAESVTRLGGEYSEYHLGDNK